MDADQASCDTKIMGERHIMIAVDGSDNARRAVAFVADFLGCYTGLKVTLLHIILEPEDTYFPDEKTRRQWLADQDGDAKKFMKEYRHILVAAGFSEDKVDVRIDTMHGASIADCIMKEQEVMKCHIVVIGRRGISKKEEFIFGSTSNRIIHEAQKCAVLVIE